METLLALCKIG